MKCSSCGQTRAVQPKNSRLMPGTRLFLCEDCTGMEPRYLVLIYGRQHGLPSVADYIKKHKYHGKEILAAELV